MLSDDKKYLDALDAYIKEHPKDHNALRIRGQYVINKSNKGLLGDLKADFRRELSVTKIKDVYPKAKSKEEKEMVEAINSLSLGFRFLDDKKDEKGITRNRKNDLIKLAGLVKGIIAAVQQSLLVVNDDHPHVRHLR